MFERYLSEKTKLPLPVSGYLYYITTDGIVFDNQNKEIKSFIDIDGDSAINICWVDGFKNYKVAVLVAHAFKPVNIPVSQWKHLGVLFKDENHFNLHPVNLVWKFPSTGIESNRYSGFFYIPNYTKYVIDKDGNVIQHFTGNKITGYLHDKGYRYLTLSPDVSLGRAPSTGRHRLLAMVFLDYPYNVDDLEVNHKNGIPGDDWVDNLEWVTRKENILHAFSNKLRTDNKPVIVKNHLTGEETKYFSAGECERCLGLTRSVVHYRIKSSPGIVFDPGLSFRYEDNNYKPCEPAKFGIKIKFTNTDTNEIKFFDSISKCSEYLKISKKPIQKRLLSNSKAVFKNYVFEKMC